jgi:predicted DNA-binding transcriptional regulator AlpA
MRPSKNSPTKAPIDKQVENLIDELRHRYDPLELMSKNDIAARLKVDPWTVDNIRKNDPNFPQPIWLTDKSARWRSVDILNWQSARPRGGWSPEWKRSKLRASKRKPSREAGAGR